MGPDKSQAILLFIYEITLQQKNLSAAETGCYTYGAIYSICIDTAAPSIQYIKFTTKAFAK